MRRLASLAFLAMLLLSACGGTDRPEGAVERWLISLNQGKAGEPEKYAPDALSQEILPHWESRDPGDLDVIEVGKGRPTDKTGIFVGDYEVPFRVERTSGVKIAGVVELLHRKGVWRVALIDRNPTSLKVPSQGGEPIESASAAAWLAALGISAALMLIVALIMAATPKPPPLPVQRRVEA